ncbi:MAG: hypothetical protein H6Q28_74 [Bacteroidetes bacterium]|nr:hypothetical protein [Bacteroidota bacterium]
MKSTSVAVAVLAALAGSLMLGGCLLVRETEHRIKLNDDGGGEAWLRLVDIRSDGETDSAVTVDLEDMLASFERDVEREFELRGRTLVAKKFVLQGDTLSAELQYSFGKLAGIEGLLVNASELAIVVAEEREIVRTNGTVSPWHQNSQKISWPRDAQRLMYRVRERTVPSSVPLGPGYRQRMQK